MPKALEQQPFEASLAAVTIAGESVGDGPDVVLAHGLTATRRYTVMGSRALPKAGFRLTTYDARGHGESSPAPAPERYEYADLARDLGAVLDTIGAERAVVGGASMGAATALAYAFESPERIRGLVLITPAYSGAPPQDEATLREWDSLSDGLRQGGVDGFLAAYEPTVDGRWKDTVMTVARQRLERHRHPEAVADALRVVPRSAAFHGLDTLERIEIPALIVASRDEADPAHPLRVGEQYAERLPAAELVTEEPGESPLAWQGARLSRTIAEFLERLH